MVGLNGNAEGIKKRAALHSPGNFTGTKTLGADFHLSAFAAAHIDLDALQIDKPPSPGMSIRVTHVIARDGTAPATLAYLCHFPTSYRT